MFAFHKVSLFDCELTLLSYHPKSLLLLFFFVTHVDGLLELALTDKQESPARKSSFHKLHSLYKEFLDSKDSLSAISGLGQFLYK